MDAQDPALSLNIAPASISPMLGRHHTDETKIKLQMSQSSRMSINVYDTKMKESKDYPSVRAAARSLNCTQSSFI